MGGWTNQNTYRWGIGHPEHSVADQLLALAEFETLVADEEISGTRSTLGLETNLTEFYFQAVADLETEALLGPRAPPYWDEDDDLPHVINVDPDMKQRIRALAHETGVAEGLPAGWALRDLEPGQMSEMLGVLNTGDDTA